MKINWTLLSTSVLLLGGFFLVRGTEDFLRGLGYAFVLGACVVQLRYVLESISDYRKRRLDEGSSDAQRRSRSTMASDRTASA